MYRVHKIHSEILQVYKYYFLLISYSPNLLHISFWKKPFTIALFKMLLFSLLIFSREILTILILVFSHLTYFS